MKRLIPVLAAAFVASLTVLASFRESHAQDRKEAWPSGGVTPQRIPMGVGKSRIIDLPRDAAEIFVANPRIANAVVRSPRKDAHISLVYPCFLVFTKHLKCKAFVSYRLYH